MELKDFANELVEDREEKVIEPTKISVDELMPKLNEYKKILEGNEDNDEYVTPEQYSQLQKLMGTKNIYSKMTNEDSKAYARSGFSGKLKKSVYDRLMVLLNQ